MPPRPPRTIPLPGGRPLQDGARRGGRPPSSQHGSGARGHGGGRPDLHGGDPPRSGGGRIRMGLAAHRAPWPEFCSSPGGARRPCASPARSRWKVAAPTRAAATLLARVVAPIISDLRPSSLPRKPSFFLIGIHTPSSC
ncbi:hypothetical protein PVAP13_4KG270205 [Panicum virgatum]|uniref:Uncharacterized protein n=1 Tax=Panicum virgatum TaxID=38727 RepID=A0A8T0TT64_PANVG|nr:hypothetical protein PVAP13_4KG270205 [Panicum virgatum]